MLLFTWDEDGLVISNQKYQNSCEQAKLIYMSRLHDPEIAAKLKSYIGESEYILAEADQINEKENYVAQQGAYESSAFLLEKLLQKHPERTAAYLNLGDAYRGVKSYEKAKAAYETYIAMMKKAGLKSRIPDHVKARIRQ